LKLDIDLLRDIMLEVESAPSVYDSWKMLDPDAGITRSMLYYHVHMLVAEGLIEAELTPYRCVREHYRIFGLTLAGCVVLDQIRNPKIWKQGKAKALAEGATTFGLKLIGTACAGIAEGAVRAIL